MRDAAILAAALFGFVGLPGAILTENIAGFFEIRARIENSGGGASVAGTEEIQE